MKSDVLIIDGSHALHRVSYIADKNPTIEYFVFLFMKILLSTVSKVPAKVIVLWDKGSTHWKKAIYPDYKKSRRDGEVDERLLTYRKARAYLHERLPTLGFASVLTPGIEADEYAFLLSDRCSTNGISYCLVSADKDWYMGLAPYGKILNPSKTGESAIYTYEDFDSDYRIMEYDSRMVFLYCKAFEGDKSDEIVGYFGVGSKTAIKIVKKILTDIPLDPKYKVERTILDDDFMRFYTNIQAMNYNIPEKYQPEMLKSIISAVSQVKRPTQIQWTVFAGGINSSTLAEGRWYNIVNKIDTNYSEDFIRVFK